MLWHVVGSNPGQVHLEESDSNRKPVRDFISNMPQGKTTVVLISVNTIWWFEVQTPDILSLEDYLDNQLGQFWNDISLCADFTGGSKLPNNQVCPMLVLMLANGQQLVVLVVPSALLGDQFSLILLRNAVADYNLPFCSSRFRPSNLKHPCFFFFFNWLLRFSMNFNWILFTVYCASLSHSGWTCRDVSSAPPLLRSWQRRPPLSAIDIQSFKHQYWYRWITPTTCTILSLFLQ